MQYQKKGQSYLNGFLLKRVLPLYLINIILIIFYSISNLLLKDEFSLIAILQSLFFGNTVISKGWYLQTILLWYMIFFIVFKFAKTDRQQIIAMICAFFVYLLVCLALKLESTWYEGVFCLILGIIWAKYFKKINDFLSENRRFVLSILTFVVLFLVSFIFGNFNFLPKFMRIFAKSISACAFTILVILLLRILPIDNFITSFLGKISLEIYVFHGFFLTFYRSSYVYINSWITYVVLIFVSTILFALLIHPLFSVILKIGRKEKIKNGNEN